MKSFAGVVMMVLIGCGGSTPQVYRHMPKVPPEPVAVGAVAAAAALTLANPDLSGKPAEDPGAPRNLKAPRSQGQVPASVLDRLDEQGPASGDEQDSEAEPAEECARSRPVDPGEPGRTGKAGKAGKSAPTLELIPTGKAGEGATSGRGATARVPCGASEASPDDEASPDARAPRAPDAATGSAP